ncbi:hypothetical protein EIP91_004964 [Steccherinum ochraceum]|uniref:Thioredoxin domain-containing protein n=1 Tax=Steccherinum ochraceum TaxID=92696 RepID=A0A4R0R7W5_9APHY|nr:hypothetical protein EIP91_004964 [Steccherinum ochraceum]
MSQVLEVDALENAKKLKVRDVDGTEFTFGSLIEKQDSIVVFIRHFFCGNCQYYTRQLAAIKPDALEKANKQLFIVGCGEPHLIKYYVRQTGFKGPIYADPSRTIFQTLGLIENLATTPKREPKKSYLPSSYVMSVLSSIWMKLTDSINFDQQGPLKNPQDIGKSGKISQLGGEFIFTKDGQCTFGWRMRHTEDHFEVADLMREAGIEYP